MYLHKEEEESSMYSNYSHDDRDRLAASHQINSHHWLSIVCTLCCLRMTDEKKKAIIMLYYMYIYAKFAAWMCTDHSHTCSIRRTLSQFSRDFMRAYTQYSMQHTRRNFAVFTWASKYRVVRGCSATMYINIHISTQNKAYAQKNTYLSFAAYIRCWLCGIAFKITQISIVIVSLFNVIC